MAEPWIKVEHGTPEKLEVSRIADLLAKSENEIFGALVRLWIWADRNTADGHALSVTAATIDRRADCVGLADAMREVGWLEGRDAALSFPRFARHNGQSAKARAQAVDRKDRQRSRECHAASVTKTGPEEEEDKSKKREGEREAAHAPLDAALPTAAEVETYCQAKMIPVAFARNYHSLRSEKNEWLNTHGKLIDWRAQVSRHWSQFGHEWSARQKGGASTPTSKLKMVES